MTAHRPHPAPAVVFVHGMRTSSAIWAHQLEHVRDAGHPAVAVDLPAHGARYDERFSLTRAFEVIDEAVESFDGRPVALVGLSLGGYTSLGWAARHASDGGAPLAGIVAAGCSSDPRGKPVALFRDVARVTVAGTTAVGRYVRRAGTRWRALATGRSVAGGADAAAFGGPRSSSVYTPGWDVVTDALTQLAGRSSVADLRAARAPVWLVNGARDRMRLEEARHLAAAERGALVVVPRAGHDVNTDAPEAFNRVLDRALREFSRTHSPSPVPAR
ncbi:alpha/beta fold hydrolase [Isoptericola variabilis]|uniref:Alpha/beta hydrolase fold protein n=1 Tax=Isoptericola variabilis (strain 225) TaxID=743718 RepID=F6FXA2_ISOV2|nr:alpha/beta hydrolase [Isoptericola variabilis]AEG43605.1 alpha/beta hydrolase fold protein [Isoptericola variabilis 225]TWH32027.1 pimeloyl-ACP methyl ester carboxylesterase [Isoptericola variabilis J7]